MTRIAEFFLFVGYLFAGDDNRGRNLRRSVYDHFKRFRDAPNPPPMLARVTLLEVRWL